MITPFAKYWSWGVGSVVWLTRSAGENMDIYVGGTLLGSGEIVMIESTFGVRITDFNWRREGIDDGTAGAVECGGAGVRTAGGGVVGAAAPGAGGGPRHRARPQGRPAGSSRWNGWR